jgi:3-methylcrotonyl-CoA carboxylase alpha subunit
MLASLKLLAPARGRVKEAAGCSRRSDCYAAAVFRKVLILRRGEAATRVARTCRRMGVESVVVAPRDEPASRHIEAADESIEVDFDEVEAIPVDSLPSILERAGADAAHLGYQGQPEMFQLASAAEKADVAVIGTDLDVLGALTDPATIRAAAERANVRTTQDAEDLRRPRELSVLVAADTHGASVAIAECDRSLSAGGHTLIHETPSPELLFRSDGEAFRMALFDAARRVAAELRYAGLLEVVFHIDPAGLSWVSDVKIGLPRHHTLIEMVTGTDLVALQMQIASGEAIPEELEAIQPRGHALDASILALDQADSPVSSYSVAPAPQGRVRATSSATVGLSLPADDRPLIAKLTTHAPIRHRALLSMDRMLAEMRAEPFTTNVSTLRRILADYAFRAGQYDSESAARFATA